MDLIVTDPPYGYSFMGKEWDKALPDKRIWKECLRVLKHGGFAYVMSAPRQDVLSRMMINLEDSGFNIGFTSMYWAYATGFPKAMNMSKAIDKKLGHEREIIGERERFGRENRKTSHGFGGSTNDYGDGLVSPKETITKPASEQAKKMDGSYAGFQPKPAVEVIIVCMKPLEEKGYITQALKNGKGVSWFDDCRIPFENDDDKKTAESLGKSFGGKSFDTGRYNFNVDNSFVRDKNWKPDKGRYPANLLVSDNAVDVGEITKAGKSHVRGGDAFNENTYGKNMGQFKGDICKEYNDKGDFSRYFDIDKWWESQFIITPKASKSEKNKGLDDFEEKHSPTMGDGIGGNPHDDLNPRLKKNNHPTVKPLKLMSYLITLGSREGDVILDPFMGSGTTPLASKQLNRKYIGIELDEDYFKICKARVEDC